MTGTLDRIPLDRLFPSKHNVRKAPDTPAALAELKASIRAHGLQQNLVVAPANADGRHAVLAGGRRLTALLSLRAEGALPADLTAVPCLVSPGDAAELSLAENVVRLAMHPADQVAAWAALAGNGLSVPQIARRFGVCDALVRQRLKLGGVAPAVLEAWRDDAIDLDIVTAFALSDDHDAQLAVWQQLQAQGYVFAPAVRRLLTAASVPAGAPLARFVGLEAYEAAGGRVTRDLFSTADDVFLDDAALVRRLALARLEAAAAPLRADWHWVEAVVEPDRRFLAGCGRIPAQPLELPEALAREIAAVDARLAALDAEESWDAAQEAEAEQLAARRDALERDAEACITYAADDRARAGCLVTVGRDGAIEVIAGLVRPEDAAPAAGTPAPPPAPAGRPASPERALRREAGLSQGLVDDLKAHRLQITKAHLAGDFTVAFDLALHVLAREVLQPSWQPRPLELHATASREASTLDDLGDTPAARQLAEHRAGLALDWLTLPPAESFAALAALPAAAKQALFAWCVAQCLKPQLSFEDGADPVLEAVGARFGIDVAAAWRPTAANYWSRVTRAHGLDAGAAVLGNGWRRRHDGLRKPALAAALEAVFAGAAPDPAARARAAAWLPPGLAYDGPAAAEADPGALDAGDDPAPLPAFLTGDLSGDLPGEPADA